MTPRLIIVSGPSGAGKDSVLEGALPLLPAVRKVVTNTTRPPRLTEKDGRDYHFLTRDEFLSLIKKGEYLEWAEYAGHLYGTPRASVDDLLSQGYDALLKIEIQGAKQVRTKRPDAMAVFIMPPTPDELARRLTARGDETPEQIASRLAIAEREIAEAPHFDYHIINDDLQQAISELVALLRRNTTPKTQ